MKAKSLSIICLCLAALGLTPTAYAETKQPETTMQDVKKESRDLFETLKEYGAERRDEAMEKSREALATLDRHIEALETRIDRDWERMDQAARDKSRATLRELRKQRTEVAERFGSWKDSSAGAWEQLKQGFTKAFQDLEESRKKAEKELGFRQ
jgi:gas vesicle protein